MIEHFEFRGLRIAAEIDRPGDARSDWGGTPHVEELWGVSVADPEALGAALEKDEIDRPEFADPGSISDEHLAKLLELWQDDFEDLIRNGTHA